MSMNNFISASWQAPKAVKTLITNREGGVSLPPYDTLNLGDHVGDNPNHVLENRKKINNLLPSSPYWLNQTHSDLVVSLDDFESTSKSLDYDASYTTQKNQVCAVMSADCIPLLLTDKDANFVAAIHAGWRGVENKIIQNTIHTITNKHSHIKATDMIAYIAPAICKDHFEVGFEVFEQFIALDTENEPFFENIGNNKFNCDLTQIAKLQMLKLGINEKNIFLSNICTYCQKDYFSYRRDGITGRIASLIWLEEN